MTCRSRACHQCVQSGLCLPQAIAALSKAMAADPNNAEVLLSLGVSYTNELDQGRALNFLTAWLSRQPAFTKVPFCLHSVCLVRHPMRCYCSQQVSDRWQLSFSCLRAGPQALPNGDDPHSRIFADTVIAAPETDEAVLAKMLQEAGPPQDSSQRLSHALSTFERAAAQVRTFKPALGGLPGSRNLCCLQIALCQVKEDVMY